MENGWMDGWKDGWMVGWLDGWMDGCWMELENNMVLEQNQVDSS